LQRIEFLGFIQQHYGPGAPFADLVFGLRSGRKFRPAHLVELPDLFFEAHAAEERFDPSVDFRC
jgi:hypothetical protein